MPPRLGCPAVAPQLTEGRVRGQVDSVTPAARPACSSWRRLRPSRWRGWVVSMKALSQCKVLDATVQLRATGYKTVVHLGLIVEIRGNPVGLRRTACGGAGAIGSNVQALTAMVDRC